MGGLLDKANATSQEETTAEPVKSADKKLNKINLIQALYLMLFIIKNLS